mgnify:CR=1 FL=1
MGLPGLQKLNIPQNKSTSSASKSNGASELKHVAARNLATTSRASGATSYGIFAQRSAAGTGAIFSPKQTYGSAIDTQRAYMNANRTIVGNNFYGGHNCSGNYDNGMNKFMAGMMALNMLGELTAQTVNAVKSTKSTEGAGGNDKTATTTSSSTKSLNEMKSAKDSSTLRGAIESAKADKSGMEAELKTLESKLPEMKEASEAAQKKVDELKPQVKQAEQDYKDAEASEKECKTNFENAEQNLKNKDSGFNDACKNLQTAKNGLSSAKGALSSARANLASAEANIDPKTKQPVEPAYSQAKDAVAKAEKDVQTAEQEVQKAEKNKQEAQGSLEEAKESKNTAKQWYLESQDKLKSAETTLKQTKENYENWQSELNKQQKVVDDYNNAVKQQTELKSKISTLDTEIPAQEKRLGELEQKEEKGLAAAENTILQMKDKMSGKDGILGTEDDKKKLGSKDQKKLDEAKDLQRNVNYTKLYKQPPTETINGKEFRTAPYDGETLYMIGAKKVDKTTYDLKKGLAEEAQKGTKEANEILNRNLQNALSPELRKKIQGP